MFTEGIGSVESPLEGLLVLRSKTREIEIYHGRFFGFVLRHLWGNR